MIGVALSGTLALLWVFTIVWLVVLAGDPYRKTWQSVIALVFAFFLFVIPVSYVVNEINESNKRYNERCETLGGERVHYGKSGTYCVMGNGEYVDVREQ